MSATVDLVGFDGLEQQLEKLSQAAGKGVVRRSLKKAAEPLADLMRVYAPEGEGELIASIGVSTRLSKRQKRLHRKMFRDDRASVEMFVGAGAVPQAVTTEFGTYIMAAQPWARPAWDSEQMQVLNRLGDHLWQEVEKSVLRAERRAARAQGG